MVDWIQPYMPSKGCVARIYRKSTEATMKPLSVTALWNRELAALNYTPEWGTIWSNLNRTSKNLAHQLIHFKVIHRAYLTYNRIEDLK